MAPASGSPRSSPAPCSTSSPMSRPGGRSRVARSAEVAIYVLRTWKIKPGTWREFQELSNNDIWPAMEAAGAKIIGLWQTIIGEGNEVVLLTRYDDLAMWERTRTWAAAPPAGVDADL